MFGIWDDEQKRVLKQEEIYNLDLFVDCDGVVMQFNYTTIDFWDAINGRFVESEELIAQMVDVSNRYKPLWKVGCG